MTDGLKCSDVNLMRIRFDLKTACFHLDGQEFESFGRLRIELAKIKIAHVYQMPYEFTTVHLFNLMKRKGWVQEIRGGKYSIAIL